jgi:hypothetical protein
MDVAPVIKDGRTYLPARWVANALGYQVDWNAANQIVIIWPNGTPKPDYSNVTKQAQPASGGNTINGYAIPQSSQVTATDGTDPVDGYKVAGEDINITVWLHGQNWDDNMAPVTESVQQQLADVQATLAQKFDAQTVQAVMSYIAPKTTLDYNLALKSWHANGKTIWAAGGPGNNLNIIVESS